MDNCVFLNNTFYLDFLQKYDCKLHLATGESVINGEKVQLARKVAAVPSVRVLVNKTVEISAESEMIVSGRLAMPWSELVTSVPTVIESCPMFEAKFSEMGISCIPTAVDPSKSEVPLLLANASLSPVEILGGTL